MQSLSPRGISKTREGNRVCRLGLSHGTLLKERRKAGSNWRRRGTEIKLGGKGGGWLVRFGRQFCHTENKQRAKSWAWGNKEHPSDGTTPSHREQALSFAAPHWPPHQCPPPGCDRGCLFYVLSCSLGRFTENSTKSAVRHSPCCAGFPYFPTTDHVAGPSSSTADQVAPQRAKWWDSGPSGGTAGQVVGQRVEWFRNRGAALQGIKCKGRSKKGSAEVT